MVKKVILATITVMALSASAFACGGMGKMEMGCDNSSQNIKGQKNHTMSKGCSSPSSQGCGMGQSGGCCSGGLALKAVDLSAEQQSKLALLTKEMKAKMAELMLKEKTKPEPLMAIENGAFSAELFKKQATERMNKHLSVKAEYFAKVWDILTSEQKQKLVQLATDK